jgi:hypothetical protein
VLRHERMFLLNSGGLNGPLPGFALERIVELPASRPTFLLVRGRRESASR